MNFGDKCQNFLLFIAIPIASDEGWTSNVGSSHHIYIRQWSRAMELIA